MSKVVIGIDAGTTTIKALVVGIDGEVFGTAARTMTVDTRGGAERDMDAVWLAVTDVVREALAVPGDVNVLAVGVTGQGDGAWLVDADGAPVRPAILWLDGRSEAVVRKWEVDGRAAAVWDATGSVPFAGSLPAIVDWLRENEPDTLRRARYHLNCKDWTRFRLTGEIATDPSDASRTYLDVATGKYSDAMLDALGHRDIRRLLPPVLPSTSFGGRVTAAAAEETGLPVGTPVIVGAVDTAATAAGLGLSSPGQAYAILGTTAFYAVITASFRRLPSPMGFSLPLGIVPGWLSAMAPMAAAPNLDWSRRALGYSTDSWQEVEAAAESAGPGAGGVVYLPYLAESGERAPFVDGDASAAFLGITRATTRGQLVRAVYEGVALSLVDSLNELPAVERLRIGGGASSGFFCQILSDVTGLPIERPRCTEFGARGVAAAALVAGGACRDIEDALYTLATDIDTFTPRPEARTVHQAQVQVFRQIRTAVAPTWGQLRILGRHSRAVLPPSAADDIPTREAPSS
jgi:sugar (pentulose or hexulose) kinase